jgi:serine/threonine protein kinase
MPVATPLDLVDTLRQFSLLEAKQLEELSQKLVPACPDLKQLAKELVGRGWLTVFQVNQINRGRAQDLVLDQYILLEVLGEGGMGQVFKARQRRLKRLAALKVIRKEYLNSISAVDRFHREAEAAARLAHPNIVAVYDAGEANGTHYLAMEYVEGTDLSKLLKTKGSPAPGLACEYIRQAALGLQHAHEQGLVHRDIKPSNLMLTDKGVVKVMDMGLARLSSAKDGDTQPGDLTSSGTVMGTPDYIAPEQAMNAKRVDIRADIYSLGCALFHLLAGEPPFSGQSLTEKLLKHQIEEPSRVEMLRPGLPKDLPAVLRRMMAKKPEQRYATPAEVAEALQPFAVAVPVSRAAPLALLVKDEQQATLAQAKAEALPTPSLAELSRPGQNGRRKKMLAGGAALGLAVLLAILLTGRGKRAVDPQSAEVRRTAPSSPRSATEVTWPAPGEQGEYLKSLKPIEKQNWWFVPPQKGPPEGEDEPRPKEDTPSSDKVEKVVVRIKGKHWPHGIFMHPAPPPADGEPVSLSYRLAKRYRNFCSLVSLNDGPMRSEVPLTFKVYGDGKLLKSSRPVSAQADTQCIEASVKGVDVLKIEVTCPAEPPKGAHAVWIEPFVAR